MGWPFDQQKCWIFVIHNSVTVRIKRYVDKTVTIETVDKQDVW